MKFAMQSHPKWQGISAPGETTYHWGPHDQRGPCSRVRYPPFRGLRLRRDLALYLVLPSRLVEDGEDL